jgi:hypothetical protein
MHRVAVFKAGGVGFFNIKMQFQSEFLGYTAKDPFKNSLAVGAGAAAHAHMFAVLYFKNPGILGVEMYMPL